MSAYQKLTSVFNKLSQLSYAQSILSWDEAVMMPEGAGATRGRALAALNGIMQTMLRRKANQKLIAAAKLEDNLSEWERANLLLMEKAYLRAACIPSKLSEKLTIEALASEQAWRKLRGQNNWREFLPRFKRVFQLTKEVAERRAAVLQLSPYDALLDEYAPGFNQASIDKIFAGLKQTIPELVKKIIHKQANETLQQPVGPFAIEQQKQLGMQVMCALQFDFMQGRLDVSHHPFCGGGASDVRITTRYNEQEFISSLSGICHETGHGLYEQGLPREWLDQPVGRVHSMAMHESQSLLIEMQICCSREFYKYLLPEIQQKFGQQEALTADNLYKLVTRVQPNLIRVDADEVTYPLHVILRYEIEKSLLNGELSVKDLPARWDELMQQYFGLSTKKNYKDGVMQDVHWPAGAFGYFPAYTLGRLIAAQLFATFLQAHPHFFTELSQGNFSALRNWLQTHVHSQASLLSTKDLLTKVTGESLNPSFFIKHVEQRYLE